MTGRGLPARARRMSFRPAYTAAIALILALAQAHLTLGQSLEANDAHEAACPTPILMAPGPDVDEGPDGVEMPDLSGGTWTSMARAPFGSEYGPVVWTGSRMIAFDSDSGRTATYRPDRDRWREVATAPRRSDLTAPFVWTGNELVITEMDEEGTRLQGLAYQPDEDRWRQLAGHEVDPDGRPDHALADALWTGTHVVVVDSLGLLAAYDPAADCWTGLGAVPGEPWAWGLYRSADAILVESRRWDEPVEIRAFDPATGVWSEPSIGPLDRDASEGGGSWIDGRLMYVTWYPTTDVRTSWNAVFDPATMTWEEFEHECPANASGTIQAAGLLVASDGTRAMDGRALECVDLPAPPQPLNGTERSVWTGEELIAWSGIRSLAEPPRRRGLVLRPAADPECEC